MKKFVKEFKEFAMRGSVMDLAIGIVIGGAFGNIVSSFVSDVLIKYFSNVKTLRCANILFLMTI